MCLNNTLAELHRCHFRNCRAAVDETSEVVEVVHMVDKAVADENLVDVVDEILAPGDETVLVADIESVAEAWAYHKLAVLVQSQLRPKREMLKALR